MLVGDRKQLLYHLFISMSPLPRAHTKLAPENDLNIVVCYSEFGSGSRLDLIWWLRAMFIVIFGVAGSQDL